ncbi:hypothetical protein [Kitasatospora sp. NPDC057541]
METEAPVDEDLSAVVPGDVLADGADLVVAARELLGVVVQQVLEEPP